MKRKPDWPQIVAREIEAAFRQPFSYGRHDCCLFAANVALAMTGVDLAKGLRGRYRSAAGAEKVLGGPLYRFISALMKRHGCRRVSGPLVQCGDIVYGRMPGEDGDIPALGVCIGRLAAFVSDGLTFVPMSAIKCGWAIGHG